jgi:hypothetical protein
VVACAFAPEVIAPPELRTTTPGAGSVAISLDPDDGVGTAAWSGPDDSPDPDPAPTEPAPVGDVDPPDDITPGPVFESEPPGPGLTTCDAPGDGSAVGSAVAMPGWAVAATHMPSATARTPT